MGRIDPPLEHSGKAPCLFKHVNGIESVWAVLKRGFYGIFHSFSRKHLSMYVDEFAFRLNEGNCRIDTVDRLESLVRGVTGKRLTCKMLIHGITSTHRSGLPKLEKQPAPKQQELYLVPHPYHAHASCHFSRCKRNGERNPPFAISISRDWYRRLLCSGSQSSLLVRQCLRQGLFPPHLNYIRHCRQVDNTSCTHMEVLHQLQHDQSNLHR